MRRCQKLFFNYDRAVRAHRGAHSAADAGVLIGADCVEIALLIALFFLKSDYFLGTGGRAESAALAAFCDNCHFCQISHHLFRTCPHRNHIRIFGHNFGDGKAKKRKHTGGTASFFNAAIGKICRKDVWNFLCGQVLIVRLPKAVLRKPLREEYAAAPEFP